MLPVFLEKVARCEVRGETMHFIWDELDLAIPIGICIANMRQCQRALDQRRVSMAESTLTSFRARH